MADGLRCADLKGAGLGSEVLVWLAEIHRKAMGSRMRSRLGSKALAKEALARRPLVRKIRARNALARTKAQTFAQTFVREQVSEYGRRP